jgi:polyribonucleotide nucleotidyltransferase
MTYARTRHRQQHPRFETGKLAKQAGGSVVVRYGDSVVLVTACRAANAREGIDFLPLTVDYREYTYASGVFPAASSSAKASRPKGSADQPRASIGRSGRSSRPVALRDADHRARAVGRSRERHRRARDHRRLGGAGLSRSRSRRRSPACRVGLVDGKYVVNPTFEQRKQSKLDLVVAGSKDGLVMVEAGAKEVTEEQVVEALEAAHAAIKQIVAAIDDLAKEAGKKKLQVQKKEIGHDFYREVEEKVLVPLTEAMRIRGKLENYDRVDQVLDDLVASLPEGEVERKVEAKQIFKDSRKSAARRGADARRPARRPQVRRVRPIWIETGVLPRTHGSAVFTRGETQALVTCTLGTADDAQKIESFEGETWKSFMLHYNFPPFSVGEVAFLRGPGRREVGHGALAERSLAPMMPPRKSSLHRARRVGHSRIERLVVDGVGLRRIAGDDGRRRAAQGAGRGIAMGS